MLGLAYISLGLKNTRGSYNMFSPQCFRYQLTRLEPSQTFYTGHPFLSVCVSCPPLPGVFHAQPLSVATCTCDLIVVLMSHLLEERESVLPAIECSAFVTPWSLSSHFSMISVMFAVHSRTRNYLLVFCPKGQKRRAYPS